MLLCPTFSKESVEIQKRFLQDPLTQLDLTCAGESKDEQCAVLTAFNLNLKFLAESNAAFPRAVECAAYMEADSITDAHLFPISAERDRAFNDSATINGFRLTVKRTSLMQFAEDATKNAVGAISIHRVVQLALRLNLSTADNLAILQLLVRWFAAHFLDDTSASINFTFLLRQIEQRSTFYSALLPTDRCVVEGYVAVAEQYQKKNEHMVALEFVERALRHGQAVLTPQANSKVEQLVLRALQSINWSGVKAGWVAGHLLGRLPLEVQRKAVQVMVFFARKWQQGFRTGENWKAANLVKAEESECALSSFFALMATLRSLQAGVVDAATQADINGLDEEVKKVLASGIEHTETMIEDNSVGSSRVDLQACKLEYSIVSPK